MIFRLARLAVGAALLALGTPVADVRAHTCTPDPEVGVAARLLLPRASGLLAVDLPERAAR